MRYLIRGAGIGLLAGALLFLFPFLFRFLLIVLLISVIIRFFFGWRRSRHWDRYHRYYGNSPFTNYYEEGIISIDGRGYVVPAGEKGLRNKENFRTELRRKGDKEGFINVD